MVFTVPETNCNITYTNYSNPTRKEYSQVQEQQEQESAMSLQRQVSLIRIYHAKKHLPYLKI